MPQHFGSQRALDLSASRAPVATTIVLFLVVAALLVFILLV
jgi:hypothetical protein